MRKIISAAAAVLLMAAPTFAASWHENADTTWYISGAHAGTAEDPYVITTARELAGLAALVNATDASNGGDASANFGVGEHFALGADIDLSGADWRPIGWFIDFGGIGGEGNFGFGGTFDGRGRSIVGMRAVGVEQRDTGYRTVAPGLFGYVSPGAEIKNLYVEGMSGASNANGAGLLVGKPAGAVYRNCVASGDVSTEGSSFTRAYAGMMGATDDGSRFYGCAVYGTVTAEMSGFGSKYAASFVGYASQGTAGGSGIVHRPTELHGCASLVRSIRTTGQRAALCGGTMPSLFNDVSYLARGDVPSMPTALESGVTTAADEGNMTVVAALLDASLAARTHATEEDVVLSLALYPAGGRLGDLSCEWRSDAPDMEVRSTSGASAVVRSATSGEKSFTVTVRGLPGMAQGEYAVLYGTAKFAPRQAQDGGSGGGCAAGEGLLALTALAAIATRRLAHLASSSPG